MTRLLVVMGSGETAPTMVKPHRAIFERVDGPAVLLDTPYGFQSNADDISAQGGGLLRVERGPRDRGGVVAHAAVRRGRPASARSPPLRDAGWVFAGPGSPTYTLRQWRETPIPALLADKLTRGGVVVFASAAALTLGTHTVPVYEIYKAGVEPHWEPGLNLVEAVLGFPAVVIPHYDNAEGGHHDTRYCYLGEARLSAMEAALPDGRAHHRGRRAHGGAVRRRRADGLGGRQRHADPAPGRRAASVHKAGAVLSFDEVAAGPSASAPRARGRRRRPRSPSPRRPRVVVVARHGRRARRPLRGVPVGARRRRLRGVRAGAGGGDGRLVGRHADLRRGRARAGHVAHHGRAAGRAGPASAPATRAPRSRRSSTRCWRSAPGPAPAATSRTSDEVRDRLAAAGVEVRDTPDGADLAPGRRLAQPRATPRQTVPTPRRAPARATAPVARRPTAPNPRRPQGPREPRAHSRAPIARRRQTHAARKVRANTAHLAPHSRKAPTHDARRPTAPNPRRPQGPREHRAPSHPLTQSPDPRRPSPDGAKPTPPARSAPNTAHLAPTHAKPRPTTPVASCGPARHRLARHRQVSVTWPISAPGQANLRRVARILARATPAGRRRSPTPRGKSP